MAGAGAVFHLAGAADVNEVAADPVRAVRLNVEGTARVLNAARQDFTILRYGIPYGPRMRDALVVARFVAAARQGTPITIAGTGEQQRNYVYVEDLADAHVRALAPAAADQTLTLEGGTPVSVREIAETVCDLVAPVLVEYVPARAADYAGAAISPSLAKELLDWAAVTPFSAGVRRYLDWLDTQ